MIRRWKILGLFAVLAAVALGACGRAGENEVPPNADPNAEVLKKERDIHGHR